MVIDCLSPWNRPRPDSLCYMVSEEKVNWTQANQVSWKRLSVYINSKRGSDNTYVNENFKE